MTITIESLKKAEGLEELKGSLSVRLTKEEGFTLVALLSEAHNLCRIVELGRPEMVKANYARDLRRRIEELIPATAA